MRAKYSGTCGACGNRFPVGANIISAGSSYTHTVCPATWYSRVRDLNDNRPLGIAAAIGAAIEVLQAEYDCDNMHGAYYISDIDVTRLAGFAAHLLTQRGNVGDVERAQAVTEQARIIRQRRKQDKQVRSAA